MASNPKSAIQNPKSFLRLSCLPHGHAKSPMKRLTALFLEGLIAILPLAVTVILIGWLGRTAERTLGVAIKWVLPKAWYLPGMGVAAGLVVIFLAGLLMNIYGVPRLIRWSETFIA